MERLTAPIPNGFPVGDLWVHHAEIRPLNGYDEQSLFETHNFSAPFKTTMLLERVATFGSITEKLDLHETVRHLTVGDRVALILQVRKATFGDKLESVLNCPACKERLSLELSVNSLLQPLNYEAKMEYPLKFKKFSIKVRPASGADLEALTENCSASNLLEQLIRSCIVTSQPPLPKKLSAEFQRAISSRLEEIDTQADTVLNLNCPNCNHSFRAPFDAENYFFEENAGRYKQLEREVHWIALHYHWNESAILSLPVTKRKRYIDLINATLSGEGI